MKNLFTYYLKKNWPFLVFVTLAGIIINFMILADSGNFYYEFWVTNQEMNTIVYDPPLEFVVIFAAIIATIIPMINFSFKMKKINVDLMYSLPIKRSKLFLTTLLFSFVEIAIPLTLVYLQSFMKVVVSDHLYNLSYFLLFYPVLLFISLLLCSVVSFIYCRNNRIIDGVINVGLFALVPLTTIYALQLLLKHYNSTIFVNKILDGSYYSIYSPFFTLSDTFFTLIKGRKLDGLTHGYNLTILISNIIFTLAGIASVYGLAKFASIDKAENTMQKSTSAFSYKVMIPLLVITMFVLGHDDIGLYIGYITVGGIALYCFYHRTVKLKFKQWLLIVAYIIIGLILAIIADNVTSPQYIPEIIQSMLH